MVLVHKLPSAEACVLEVKLIHDQYADASYSVFVEAPANSAIYAEYYHYSFFEVLRAELECSAKSGECSAILDLLACGNAILGRKLLAQILSPSAAAGVRVTVVDASEAILKEARRLCAAEALESLFTFVHSNVESLPVDLGLFNCVISSFFFWAREQQGADVPVFCEHCQAPEARRLYAPHHPCANQRAVGSRRLR